MSSSRVVLRLSDVVKTFPGVVALKGVGFEVVAGEVHALVGENGAGKSTLMAVAAGAIAPDRGTIEIGGHPLTTASPTVAQALGLAVVYQHLSILEDLTVTENMVFAMPPDRRPRMARAAAWTRRQLLSADADIDPQARVNELGSADRQLLEIAKALALESKVLVLDEPTESLNAAESERLFAQIRSITAGGTAVVYISHRLPEVKQVADRLTVLRDGEVRGTFPAREVSEGEILRLIIGRSVDQVFPEKRSVEGGEPPVLQVRGLGGAQFHDVDLEVAPGEIVGLAGVEGNGQRPFLRALAGLVPASGSVEAAGKAVTSGSPGRALDAGIVHLPGDRHREGVLLSLGVRENISLLSLVRSARNGFVQRRRETALASDQVAGLAVRTPSLETPASSLSGGNQQKLLFARALLAEPTVFLADEPTRGVDAGARIELYRVLRQMADDGKAVVLLSSDAIELQGLCDRVLVFSRGRIVRTLEGGEITEENITGAALTSTSEHTRLTERARNLLRARRFVSGDYLPSLILALLVIGLGAYTSVDKSRFLSAFNFRDMLLVASALAFVSLGQLVVLLAGGIDLSVGPLAGLVIVVLSFFVGSGAGGGRLALGILAVIGTGLAVGLANGVMIRAFKLAPVLATLASYIVLQGIALLLRPEIGGFYRIGVLDALRTSIGWVPVAFIVAAVLTVACELALRFTRAGLQLRAVGSDEVRAHRLGARVTRTQLAAYVLCSLLTVAGGIMLGAHVGVGDPLAGVNSNFTLTSIAAVVLGGASIFGGRGSFVGAFLGALLIQEVTTSTTFLQLGVAWQYWLPGLLILVAAGTYSRARGVRAAALGAEA